MIETDKISLPNHSRVWIYQADRQLTEQEMKTIISRGSEFTATWAAHGHELMAELQVLNQHFIVIALDEEVEAASGCSIDKAMRLILELQKELNVGLTNRMISAFWSDDKVRLFTYGEVKEALATGTLTAESQVFDNTVQTVNDLKDNWLKPLHQTWLKKCLADQNV